MIGKRRIVSPRERLLSNIVDLWQGYVTQFGEESDVGLSTLATCVQELVRDIMREIAQQPKDVPEDQDHGLLTSAKCRARKLIQDRLVEKEGGFEKLDSILAEAADGLRSIEKDLGQLSRKLLVTREKKRLKEKLYFKTSAEGTYSLTSIGLEAFCTGLLVTPDPNLEWEADFEKLQNHGCVIEDEDFPVEVTFASHVFVVDDDGSIYVSVDGLPESVVIEVENNLTTIADLLYSRVN